VVRPCDHVLRQAGSVGDELARIEVREQLCREHVERPQASRAGSPPSRSSFRVSFQKLTIRSLVIVSDGSEVRSHSRTRATARENARENCTESTSCSGSAEAARPAATGSVKV
jgi:hypothetical protein